MKFLKSVKIQLTLWYVFVLSISLSILSWLMYFELSRVLYRDADTILFYEAQGIESTLQPYLEDLLKGEKVKKKHQYLSTSLYFDPEVREHLREAIEKWENENQKIAQSTMMIRLLGLDHQPISVNLKRWEEEVIFPDFERDSIFLETGESFQTIHFRKKPIRLYYRLFYSDEVPLFVIQTGISIQNVKETLGRLRWIILLTVPLSVLAAGMTGWFLALRSFRPVDLMIREARKITAPNIQGRLSRTGTGDEVDRLAATLNEMIDRIEASTRAIQEFSSDISHELKTPLAIIRGEIDLAFRKSRSAEDLTQTLRVIEEEVSGLIRLVDDLLFLVKTDAKQLRFEMQELDLGEVIQTAAERFRARASAKSLQFQIRAENGFIVTGDPVYLKRLFSNLIDNAIKFTPEKGSIAVETLRFTDKAVVRVIDSGMGIEPDKIEKLFSRFYRTDAARQYEGSGLGLNIAKAICDAHQGKIEVTSSSGRGTTVLVSLPLS